MTMKTVFHFTLWLSCKCCLHLLSKSSRIHNPTFLRSTIYPSKFFFRDVGALRCPFIFCLLLCTVSSTFNCFTSTELKSDTNRTELACGLNAWGRNKSMMACSVCVCACTLWFMMAWTSTSQSNSHSSNSSSSFRWDRPPLSHREQSAPATLTALSPRCPPVECLIWWRCTTACRSIIYDYVLINNLFINSLPSIGQLHCCCYCRRCCCRCCFLASCCCSGLQCSITANQQQFTLVYSFSPFTTFLLIFCRSVLHCLAVPVFRPFSGARLCASYLFSRFFCSYCPQHFFSLFAFFFSSFYGAQSSILVLLGLVTVSLAVKTLFSLFFSFFLGRPLCFFSCCHSVALSFTACLSASTGNH